MEERQSRVATLIRYVIGVGVGALLLLPLTALAATISVNITVALPTPWRRAPALPARHALE